MRWRLRLASRSPRFGLVWSPLPRQGLRVAGWPCGPALADRVFVGMRGARRVACQGSRSWRSPGVTHRASSVRSAILLVRGRRTRPGGGMLGAGGPGGLGTGGLGREARGGRPWSLHGPRRGRSRRRRPLRWVRSGRVGGGVRRRWCAAFRRRLERATSVGTAVQSSMGTDTA